MRSKEVDESAVDLGLADLDHVMWRCSVGGSGGIFGRERDVRLHQFGLAGSRGPALLVSVTAVRDQSMRRLGKWSSKIGPNAPGDR